MPTPPPENEAIFHAARDIPESDSRREYVRQACGGDPKRIAFVEALLAAADGPDSLLDQPAIGPAADATRTGPSVPEEDLSLDFLASSTEPGSLGRIEHYEVKEVIGQGGMGIVLRAFDEKLHRVVAIKVMAAALAATSPPRKRFLREARAAAAVRHDHVVDIHAVEEQPIPYLVMEYIPGETLQQKLDRVGPLETPEVLRLGQQIARGLAAAHAQGLIHRDIKPSNILLENGAEERVKITDFGLARAVDDVSLTQSGVIAGTPMYMAPEQTLGETTDHRADLFSLGSVLYTMCSGRPPFRATNSMATLKRVAEDAPRPIREIIPEVPDWLCDIIGKLHAKRPEDRFQSAQEVAELLGKCLTGLEHGQAISVKQAAGLSEKPNLVPGSARANPRRWAAAAAVFVLVLGGLFLTEATGVTNLRATVIRILTPDGALVVETDDPAVKVTVEGDGGLVITGAGLEEIRLRPGSYRIHADRDGKPIPLDKNLVEVARGGRAIVKVKLEAPPAAVAKTLKGAFVLLGGKGVEVRKFDSLAEAVSSSADGDTIEIRGNGPFVSEPVTIIGQSLAIRAGDGFRPVVELSPKAVGSLTCLITTDSRLVLEGLELRDPSASSLKEGVKRPLVLSNSAPLYVANCRFLTLKTGCIESYGSRTVRNCELLGRIGVIGGRSVLVENSVLVGDYGVSHGFWQHSSSNCRLRLVRNSTASYYGVWFAVHPNLDFANEAEAVKPVHIASSSNVFWTSSVFLNFDQGKTLKTPDAVALVHRLLDWREQSNVYAAGRSSLQWSVNAVVQPTQGPRGLAEWRRFWKTENDDLLEGNVRFQGGNLLAKFDATPEKLTPEDFRLRPDSAGYRAGKDGKDLGADVDLVGPGPAYERWKRTPEYQQWLKDTRMKK